MKRTLFFTILICLAACGGDADEPDELTVFAAASLTDAFEALGEEFEGHNQGVEVRLNFASSSALATQIIEGAGADVFASANVQQMQNVADADELTGEPQNFAENRLVVAAYAEGEVESIEDLTAEGVTVVLVAPTTPIRVYTDESLALMNESGEFGAGFTEGVLSNLVSEEVTVRAAVLKVALGEADATIVYVTDITPDIREAVRAIDIPDEFNVLASYPIAAVSDNPLAAEFIDFVLSDEGQAILVEWGFISAQD